MLKALPEIGKCLRIFAVANKTTLYSQRLYFIKIVSYFISIEPVSGLCHLESYKSHAYKNIHLREPQWLCKFKHVVLLILVAQLFLFSLYVRKCGNVGWLMSYRVECVQKGSNASIKIVNARKRMQYDHNSVIYFRIMSTLTALE